MDITTKCQTHDLKTHYGPEHIEREIYNEKGYSIGAELFEEIVRCKDCKWYGHPGCAIRIVDDSDKPNDNDFCSFGERGE